MVMMLESPKSTEAERRSAGRAQGHEGSDCSHTGKIMMKQTFNEWRL